MSSSKWSSFVEQLKHSSPKDERHEDAKEEDSVKNSAEEGDQSDRGKVRKEATVESKRTKVDSEKETPPVETKPDQSPKSKEGGKPSPGESENSPKDSATVRASDDASTVPGHDHLHKTGLGEKLVGVLGRGVRDEVALAIGGDRVYIASRNRPEVVAYETMVALTREGELVALGKEAEAMRGQEPQSIVTEQILQNGIAADPARFAGFLKTLLKQHFQSRRYLRPRVVCAGNFPTALAKRATTDAILEAGARDVMLCDPEIAVARGLGLDVTLPELVSVLLIENDWTGSVVASMGNTITRISTYTGHNTILEDISIHLQETQGFAPRLKSLEDSLRTEGFQGTLRLEGWEAWGDQLEKGRPKTLEVSGEECSQAVRHYFLQLKHRINRSLEPLDRDRRWSVENSPIHLAGPCANVPGFADMVEKVLNRKVKVSPESAWALGHGLVELLSEKDFLSRLRTNI